jgi:hypothetical protein
METKDIIEKIYKLHEEVQELLQKESDQYIEATSHREDKITITREEKEIECTEGELWEEVRIVGGSGEAAKILKEKYSEVFETAEIRESKNKELHDFIQETLGFSFRQMGIADYMKLTELLIDYKLQK